jgi:hypothetical protein
MTILRMVNKTLQFQVVEVAASFAIQDVISVLVIRILSYKTIRVFP